MASCEQAKSSSGCFFSTPTFLLIYLNPSFTLFLKQKYEQSTKAVLMIEFLKVEFTLTQDIVLNWWAMVLLSRDGNNSHSGAS